MRAFGSNSSGICANLGLICEEILTEASFGPNDRTFAWNLLHDGRVNPEWADYWYRQYGKPISPAGLRNSLINYHNDLREKPSSYAELGRRGGNSVRINMHDAPAENDSLVHVLDLWSPGARQIWNHARVMEMPILAEAADLGLDRPSPPPIITNALESGTVNGQRAIMTSFFRAFEDYFASHPVPRLNPYWVARWDPWRKCVNGSAADWCESVGLSKKRTQTPTWMAVVRYPVRRASRLFCPTQLEAGWYGRHFPTPPECRCHHGGRVVEGRPSVFSDPSRFALQEYIHEAIPLYLSDWLAAGFPVRPTTGLVGREELLERDRSAHWGTLTREFPDTGKWMADANGKNVSASKSVPGSPSPAPEAIPAPSGPFAGWWRRLTSWAGRILGNPRS